MLYLTQRVPTEERSVVLVGSLVIRGNKYYAKFRIDGKQKLVTTGIEVKGNNKRKAEKAMREIIEEYESLNLEYEWISFLSFLDLWLEKIRPNLKPVTWESYSKTISGKIKPYFKDKGILLRDLKPSELNDFFCYLAANGKSNGQGGLCYKTVKNIRGVISSACDYAVQNKYLLDNPATKSIMPSFAQSIIKEVPQYTSEQASRLLSFAKEHESHLYVFLLLALFTGMRKGELCALTWDDIDFDKKLLNINKSRSGTRSEITKIITTPKTLSSNRKIPLSDFVIDALKAERSRQKEYSNLFGSSYNNEADFVIRNALGEPYVNLSAINRVLNRLEKSAGLPHCTIHGLRHSVASILDENGVALSDISVLLGHESVQTTEKIYIRRNRTAKVSTINVLDNTVKVS